MNFTVDWTGDTLSALAALWMLSPDRREITIAQDRIDRLLAEDPFGNGKPLAEGLYSIEVGPLRALKCTLTGG